ncbi:hypothetical protein diail_1658 [Diaporthe ilicicola]|nr:hypothetical protein diail_1658 [Diaporthe ilicicola]
MSSPSPQPIEAEQREKMDWTARAATLKQQLMQRRLQTAGAQPEGISLAEDTQGQGQQQKQPKSGEAEPAQTTTTTPVQQTIPGLAYQLPDDSNLHKEASRHENSPRMTATDELDTKDNIQKPQAIPEKLMVRLTSSIPSKTVGKDKETVNTPVVGKEIEREGIAALCPDDRTAAGNRGQPDDGANHKGGRMDQKTASKDTSPSGGSMKTKMAPKEKSNTRSSTEEGEITGKPSPPLRKIPVQESTPQSAARKKTPPARARASTVTNIAPTEPRAERHVFRTVETPLAPKHREPQRDMATAHSSASRPDGKRGHGHSSMPARPAIDIPERDSAMNWKGYSAAPARHVYARPSREQRPRSASPVVRGSDPEVERFASQHPDLRDWLYYTGWDAPGFRRNELARLRRLDEIERERAALKQECEREKAELKGEGDPPGRARHASDGGARPPLLLLPPAPARRAEDAEQAEYRMLGRYTVTAGMKRERGQERDGGGDGGSSTKFYRTNRNYRGSRAGYHGTHHSGREESRHWHDGEAHRRSSRTSPPAGFRESSPPRTFAQPRYPRHHRYSSPVGHPLPRNELDGERTSDRYASRDRFPHRRSVRSSSPPPHGRGHRDFRFHESEYERP